MELKKIWHHHDGPQDYLPYGRYMVTLLEDHENAPSGFAVVRHENGALLMARRSDLFDPSDRSVGFHGASDELPPGVSVGTTMVRRGTIVENDSVNARVRIRIEGVHDGIPDDRLPWTTQRDVMQGRCGLDKKAVIDQAVEDQRLREAIADAKPAPVAMETAPIPREPAGWNHGDLSLDFWRERFGGTMGGYHNCPKKKGSVRR